MKKNHGSVLLFYRAQDKARYKQWSKTFEKLGLRCQVSPFEVDSGAWEMPRDLEHSVGADLVFVGIVGAVESGPLGGLSTKLRSLPGAFKFVPLVQLLEDPADAISNHVDDVFFSTEPLVVLKARVATKFTGNQMRSELWQESRVLETELARKETALKQREEFLSVCAHDLRSPLGLVQSSIGLILNSKDHAASLSPFQKELLTRVERQSKVAIQLVKDLLDVTSFEQGLKPQYQLVTLSTLLDEFFNDYAFQAHQKSVEFHYENQVREWRVLADVDRVHQLLQNLFTNALKFTPSGKNIYLQAISFQGRRKMDPPFPMISIGLKDEGPGIPKEEIQRIFDRFNQIKDYARGDGRGLGLTVAKQISQLHDGNVWAESEPGKGATFRVLFPHVVSRTAPSELHWPPKKILVVEPNNDARQTQYRVLREMGYSLVFAKDGVEAVTFAFHEWPDLILLSMGLSKINTPEVAKILKSDPVGGAIPLVVTLPAKTALSEKYVCDGSLALPIDPSEWKKMLQTIPQASKSKKAA